MGGYGSGRPAQRATVEGCRSLQLDVNTVMRRIRKPLAARLPGAVLHAGPFGWGWQLGEADVPKACVLVTLELREWEGTARLQYDIAHLSKRTGQQDQIVWVKATSCRFGGRRWWWICPATGRRCSKLYLPNGGELFLSRGRGAYRLGYQSQRVTAVERSHTRLAKIVARLGGRYTGPDTTLPPRPFAMREKTYERYAMRWEEGRERLEQVWLNGIAKLLRRG